jgi:hypothetical protein
MNSGMLWQDKSQLTERVRHAVEYYQKKYGRKPDTAFVNPRLLTDHQAEVDGVEVRPMRLPISLLWIGVEEAAAGIERASSDLLEKIEQMETGL